MIYIEKLQSPRACIVEKCVMRHIPTSSSTIESIKLPTN